MTKGLSRCARSYVTWSEAKFSCRQPRAYLVSEDLSFRVILEVPIALEPALDDLAKLLSKDFMIEEVVHTKT